MNVMPMMFSKLKQTRDEVILDFYKNKYMINYIQIIGFNTALFLGLTTCVILNLLWYVVSVSVNQRHFDQRWYLLTFSILRQYHTNLRKIINYIQSFSQHELVHGKQNLFNRLYLSKYQIIDLFVLLRCWSIVSVVPQHSTCLSTNLNETIQMAFNLLNESQMQGQCIYSASLKQ